MAANGVLLIAKNTAVIDYGKIADWQAANIVKHLGVPVSIITDSNTAVNASLYDNIIIDSADYLTSPRYFSDYDRASPWKNGGRYRAYALSPYDSTLLMDVDYCVQCSDLHVLFESNQDFLCFRDAYDITWSNKLADDSSYGVGNLPMWWATVMYWRKSEYAEAVFSMMEMIEHNYEHYANLYGFFQTQFRNDYALSIALNTLNGHMLDRQVAIPWQLATLPTDSVVDIVGKQFVIETGGKKKKQFVVSDMDIHVMSKQCLENIIDRS